MKAIEVFNVAYIHNYYGIGNDVRFVKLEDYAKLEKENAELKEQVAKCNEWLMVFKRENSDNFEWKRQCLATIKTNYLKENAELSKALEESENREKELCILAENLKAQIEKMKCCGNCKYQCSFLFAEESECLKNEHNKWELAE